MAQREDKRIKRTKRLLRQALTKLMRQKEFQSITVTDVVREADINRGTFYAHYRDVYNLRETIESEMIADFRSMLEGIRTNSPESLHPVLARTVDYLEENREVVIGLTGSGSSDGFGQKLIHVIEEYYTSPDDNEELGARYSARFIATGVVGALEKWISEPEPISKADMSAIMEKLLAPLLSKGGGDSHTTVKERV